MTDHLKDRDIETMTYSHWDDIIGNRRLKSHFRAMAQSVIGPSQGRGINTLVLGESRTGKTSTTEFFFKVILCRNADCTILTPCSRCQPCEQHAARHGQIEVEWILDGGNTTNVGFVPINGNDVSDMELDEKIGFVAGKTQYRWFFAIDEIQGLVRRHLDHKLFKAVEQYGHLTWIVTTATTKGLDRMFRNRFTEIWTEPPTVSELAVHLAKRCRHPSIDLRWDDDRTVVRLAERCNQVTGLALKCIALAKMYGGQLTMDIVESYPFEQASL